MLRRPFIIIAMGAWAAALSPAMAATAPDWAHAQRIAIALSDFKFTPKTLSLRHGQAYRLHLTNTGSGGHNFSAPAFFRAATIAPEDTAAIVKGGVDLKKGESREIRLIPTAGRYKLKCTHFLHSGFGMKGQIVVE